MNCSVSPSCLEQPLPVSEWFSDDQDIDAMRVSATDDENTLLIVARASVITCSGNITQWSVRWYHRGATDECTDIHFIFSVFRQPTECAFIDVVGTSLYKVEDAGPEMQEVKSVFHVPPEDRFYVQEGDFLSLGVVLESECTAVESSVWVAGRTGVEAVLYHKVYHTVFGALVLSTLAPCSQLQRNNTIFPFLSAVIGEYSYVLF